MPRIEIIIRDCNKINNKLVVLLEDACKKHRYALQEWLYDADDDIAYIIYSTRTDPLRKYKEQTGHYPDYYNIQEVE